MLLVVVDSLFQIELGHPKRRWADRSWPKFQDAREIDKQLPCGGTNKPHSRSIFQVKCNISGVLNAQSTHRTFKVDDNKMSGNSEHSSPSPPVSTGSSQAHLLYHHHTSSHAPCRHFYPPQTQPPLSNSYAWPPDLPATSWMKIRVPYGCNPYRLLDPCGTWRGWSRCVRFRGLGREWRVHWWWRFWEWSWRSRTKSS